MSDYLEIGDVFKAPATFEFAYSGFSEKPYSKGVDLLEVSNRGELHMVHKKTTGYDPNTGAPITVVTEEYNHFSKARIGKEYVVEEVIALSPDEREMIRSEPKVIARRLKADGTYDPKGELITFVDKPEGVRSNYFTAATVKVHRKMKRVFV